RTVKVDYFSPYDVEADPGTQVVFKAEAYKPVVENGVEKSSYPKVYTIGQDEEYAVHTRDLDFYKPKDTPSMFDEVYDPKSGVTEPAGLRFRGVEGVNNGHPFRYSCRVPYLVQDQLAKCAGFSTRDRMPFHSGNSYLMGYASYAHGYDFV